VSLDATPRPPQRRSETEPAGYVPSMRPTAPRAQHAVLVVVFAPLVVLIAVLVAVHVATAPAVFNGGGGGNFAVGPYNSGQATSDDGQGQATYSPPSTDDGEATAPDTGDTDTDDPDGGDSTEPTVSPSDSSSTTPPADTTGPASVVEAYFAAINAKDYQTAWSLGGENQGGSYADFAAGFANTEQDTVTVESVSGDVVTVTLVAQNDDGTILNFAGTYTVTNGEITASNMQQTG
jgi:hypothetical protein